MSNKLIKKRNFRLPENDVNVVPLMDILTTTLFFLIVLASTMKFSSLTGSSEIPGAASTEPTKDKFDLVVYFKSKNEIELHLGKIDKLNVVDRNAFQGYLSGHFISDNRTNGFVSTFKIGKDYEQSLKSMSSVLQRIKMAFPQETKITLLVVDEVSYELVVHTMEFLVGIPEGMAPFKIMDKSGQPSLSRELFPSISVQESWMEGGQT